MSLRRVWSPSTRSSYAATDRRLFSNRAIQLRPFSHEQFLCTATLCTAKHSNAYQTAPLYRGTSTTHTSDEEPDQHCYQTHVQSRNASQLCAKQQAYRESCNTARDRPEKPNLSTFEPRRSLSLYLFPSRHQFRLPLLTPELDSAATQLDSCVVQREGSSPISRERQDAAERLEIAENMAFCLSLWKKALSRFFIERFFAKRQRNASYLVVVSGSGGARRCSIGRRHDASPSFFWPRREGKA